MYPVTIKFHVSCDYKYHVTTFCVSSDYKVFMYHVTIKFHVSCDYKYHVTKFCVSSDYKVLCIM